MIDINTIKEKRLTLGYTQDDMARMLGYKSKSGYCMLENGKVKLTIDTAKKISNILDISMEKIFNNYIQET